jgi:hypothetical protein
VKNNPKAGRMVCMLEKMLTPLVPYDAPIFQRCPCSLRSRLDRSPAVTQMHAVRCYDGLVVIRIAY